MHMHQPKHQHNNDNTVDVTLIWPKSGWTFYKSYQHDYCWSCLGVSRVSFEYEIEISIMSPFN
jgi:hypothetical protein